MSKKAILIAASCIGMITIILGALGAHALKAHLSAESLNSFETGVRYSAWHAIALLALFSAFEKLPKAKIIGLLWLLGILFFSGSIFILTTRSMSHLNVGFLGPITPIGGLLMISGWLLLLIDAIKLKS